MLQSPPGSGNHAWTAKSSGPEAQKGTQRIYLVGHPQCAQPQQVLLTNSVVGASYTEADAVQHLLQGFGFGLGSVGPAFAVSTPGRGAVFRQQVDVDELKGAHLVVELPCPGPDGRLLDDVDDISFL